MCSIRCQFRNFEPFIFYTMRYRSTGDNAMSIKNFHCFAENVEYLHTNGEFVLGKSRKKGERSSVIETWTNLSTWLIKWLTPLSLVISPFKSIISSGDLCNSQRKKCSIVGTILKKKTEIKIKIWQRMIAVHICILYNLCTILQ